MAQRCALRAICSACEVRERTQDDVNKTSDAAAKGQKTLGFRASGAMSFTEMPACCILSIALVESAILQGQTSR